MMIMMIVVIKLQK